MGEQDAIQPSRTMIGDLSAAIDKCVILALLDSRGRLMEVNDRFCAVTQYSRAELLGGDPDADGPAGALRELFGASCVPLSEDQTWRGEIAGTAKDGSPFWLETTLAPYRVEGSRARQIAAICGDITARKQAEAVLAEKEARLHAADRRLAEIVQSMTEACFALDHQWRFTFVNDRCSALLRRPREEMLGRSIWEEFAKLVGTPLEANFRRAMATRAAVAFEAYSAAAKRWLDIHLFPTAEGLAAFLLDITERKQTEEALRLSEWKFARAFANNPAAVALTRLDDGQIIDVNDTWESLCGYSRAEMMGKSARPIWPRPEAAARFVEELRTHGVLRGWEETFRKKSGETFVAELSAQVLTLGEETLILSTLVDITARKQAEAALRRQEALLRETGRIAQVGGWEFDVASGNGHWTEEVALIHELDPRTPPSKALGLQHYAGASRERIEAALAAAIHEGLSYDLELEFIGAKGTRKWVRTIGHPIFDQGRVVTLRGSFQDITDRKRAALALQESEELFSKAFRLSPDYVLIARASDRTVIRANEAMCRLWGRTPDEVIGQPTQEFAHWLDEAERSRFMATLAATGECLNHPAALQLYDGRRVWFNCSSRSIMLQGEPAILSVMRDVTEARLAAETLQRQAALIDQTYDAVLVWDWNGPITFWNRGAERLYGFSRAEAVGQSPHRLLQTRFGASLEQMLKILEGSQTWEGELEHTTRSGQRIAVESRMVLVREGTQVYVLETNRDVTERKRAEAAVQSLNAELERRVIARTAELEAANKELEAFSYSVSHDLRSPLRAIDGFSQAVLEDCQELLPPGSREDLQAVRAGAQRMGVLIDDLLAFSRLGRQPLKKGPVAMRPLVETVLAELQAHPSDRQVEIRLGPLPPCRGDRALLKQVWANLLGNAFKYTRMRPVAVIEIGAVAAEEGPGYFVRDNGTGFEMQYAHKLFGVFQRLHRSEDFEGTGVGLAIVQRVVQRHGGRVWAESVLDQGATFYFTIPEAAAP